MSRDRRLEGKVALITGGTSGIGLATAQLFQDEGARVVVTGRSADSLAAAARELGDQALVVRADTSDPTAIEDLFTRVEERFGAIDVLFVNAGVARFAPIDQVDAGHLDDQFAVNFRGAYFTIQRALPLVRDGGSIILNTSVVNRKGLPNTSIYAATKAALRSLARTLSAELMPRQIRVNAVSPGPIETSIYGKLGLAKADLDAFAAAVKDQVPLGRFGAPEEVARAALFLASSDSSYVVGAEIATDGGMSQL